LSGEERQVFRQLGVFVGGWTLEAAEAICTTDSGLPIFEALSLLTDKCLVQTKSFQDGMRFEFTETIREYACEKLKRAGELPAVSDRHLSHFAGVAMEAEFKLQGSGQQAVLEELAAEDDNLRAALTWGLEVNPALVLQVANSLCDYWRFRGRLVEAEGWLERAVKLEVSEQDEIMKARALCTLGLIAIAQGKPLPATQFLEVALEKFRERNDQFGVARCLGNLALVAFHRGEYDLAVSFWEEALQIVRGVGNARSVAAILNNLAMVARRMGDQHKARNCLELALQITRGLQDEHSLAGILNNLGLSYEDENDLAGAERLWSESLAIRRKLADKEGIAACLFNLANAGIEKGDYDISRRQLLEALTYYYELRERGNLASVFLYLAKVAAAKAEYRKAAVLVGSAVSLQENSAYAWSPREASTYEHLVSVLEEKLGQESFSGGVAVGRSMTIEQALTHARAASI
jgi:tetratricopeptide (TPR) repeat protein